ncbi:hypothetical protein VKT23_011682 [Stygiomarasmius scandens]|uniref:Fungal STAND N-terminal Goodbye domain-containing protein n=1 Tax=Marasmiellus scandens TaxID=2682957 RepID=A0ABR1J8L5_9AGAR
MSNTNVTEQNWADTVAKFTARAQPTPNELQVNREDFKSFIQSQNFEKGKEKSLLEYVNSIKDKVAQLENNINKGATRTEYSKQILGGIQVVIKSAKGKKKMNSWLVDTFKDLDSFLVATSYPEIPGMIKQDMKEMHEQIMNIDMKSAINTLDILGLVIQVINRNVFEKISRKFPKDEVTTSLETLNKITQERSNIINKFYLMHSDGKDQFLAIWKWAVDEYMKNLNQVKYQLDITVFDDKAKILEFLNRKKQEFASFRDGKSKIVANVLKIIEILDPIIGFVGDIVGLVIKPAEPVFTILGIIVQQIQHIQETCDKASDMLEKIEHLILLFNIDNKVKMETELKEVYVQMLAYSLIALGLIARLSAKGEIGK